MGRADRDPRAFEKFAEALRTEAEMQAHLLADQLDTLYFGGGTPSLFPPELLEEALRPLQLQNRITAETEFTLEANPASTHPKNFETYRKLGVNRISLGIQSLDARLLKKIGRVHSPKLALQALENFISEGFREISVDLLCGIPNQELADLEASLQQLLSYPIQHLSCYLLTLEPGHPLFDELPTEETQLVHLLFLDQKMREAGFRHYEISNFCKPGHPSRHNLNYWQGGSYLALGPSAHSFDAEKQKRFKNASSLERYIRDLTTQRRLPIEWEEDLSAEQISLEKWMLALRLDDGIPETWLNTTERQRKVQEYLKSELMEKHPGQPNRVRLTPRGFALSDQVISTLA